MEKVNYDNIAEGFSKSRKNMKWEEIEYFLEKYEDEINGKTILDIGCGSGRLLEHFIENLDDLDIDYYWIDASSGMIEEAKKNFWFADFFVGDMTTIDTFSKKNIETAFFIASFHHLQTLEERVLTLQNLKKILAPNSYIFLTNWALDSDDNIEKYSKNMIPNSQNEWGGRDYSIPFGEYERFYHGFSLWELEHIFTQAGFEIVENRLFDTGKNFISILKN